MCINVGDLVRVKSTEEIGRVIHVWMDEATETEDCHICSYGNVWPQGDPDKKPYILRYFTSSLSLLKEEEPSKREEPFALGNLKADLFWGKELSIYEKNKGQGSS